MTEPPETLIHKQMPMPMRLSISARLVTVAMCAVLVSPLHAQDVRQQGLPDDSAVLVDSTRIGPRAYTPFDSATVIHHATKKCGPQRRCAAGFDLAAIALEAPGPTAPADSVVGFRATIVNLGSSPAPSVPIAVTLGDAFGEARFDASQVAGQIMGPALAPGDTASFIVPVRMTARTYGQPWLFVDPQNFTGEKNSGNNAVMLPFMGEPWHADAPNVALVDVRFQPEILRIGRPSVITIVVRNTARTAPLVHGFVHVRVPDYADEFIGSDRTFALPVIPAQSEATLQVKFPATRPGRTFIDGLARQFYVALLSSKDAVLAEQYIDGVVVKR